MRTNLIACALALTLTACTTTDRADPTGAVSQATYFPTFWPNDGVLAAGSNDDWWGSGAWCNYTAGACRIAGNAAGSTLTGFDANYMPCDTAFWLYNSGAYDITIAHNNSASLVGNRILLKTGADEALRPGYSMKLGFACDASAPSQWHEFGEYHRPAPVLAVTPSTPSRSLGTAFQPSSTAVVSAHYSVQIDSTLTVTGGAAGRIELLSDGSNPPTTIRASVPGGLTGTAVLGLSVTATAGGELSYDVPAGDYVLLRSVTVSGTPTYTITHQTEESWSL